MAAGFLLLATDGSWTAGRPRRSWRGVRSGRRRATPLSRSRRCRRSTWRPSTTDFPASAPGSLGVGVALHDRGGEGETGGGVAEGDAAGQVSGGLDRGGDLLC